MSVKFEASILPLSIPDTVQVKISEKHVVEVELKELTEDQLAALAEEFTLRLFERAGKKLS